MEEEEAPRREVKDEKSLQKEKEEKSPKKDKKEEAPKEEKVEGGKPEIEPGSEVAENGEWEEIKDEDTLSISAQSNSGNMPEQGEREEKIEEERETKKARAPVTKRWRVNGRGRTA